MWKTAHPSEDSEALSEAWHQGIVQASSRTLEFSMGDACAPNACAPHWFAVYTSSRHEKRVNQQLEMREIEHYLPLYRTQRKWSDGSRVTLDLPLFPGYIFVCIERAQRVRVLEVPGVLAIVGGTGGGGRPRIATSIRDCCAASRSFSAQRPTPPSSEGRAAGTHSVRRLCRNGGGCASNEVQLVVTVLTVETRTSPIPSVEICNSGGTVMKR